MSDSEARRKKLEELRMRKNKRDEKTASIVDEILKESVPPTIEEVKEPESKPKEESVAKAPKKAQQLTTQRFVGEIEVAPKAKIETYSQEVQVDLGESEPLDQAKSVGRPTVGRRDKEIEDEEDQMLLPQKGPERRQVRQVEEEGDAKLHEETKPDLTQDEVKNLVKTKDFRDFFERSSKMIEKALDSRTVDLLEDILMDESASQYQDGAAKKEFQEVHNFYDQQLASNRVVTSIDWSPIVPELFLSSYSQSFEGNPNEPQGVLLLWSLSLRSRPEFTCYCQSQITVAKFNQHSSHIVVGGTYSGQVVVWDLRAKSTPVQRSGMAGGGHAHPVYSLSIVGTQNSHNIISLSNDGKLCVWNTNMLTTPQKEIDLKFKPQGADAAQQDIINATCITFPHEEANNFFTGVEDGTIYSAQVHANQANENVVETFTGHQAPITSLSVMPYFQDLSTDASNLLLSSSYDWTVKLWSPKFRNESIWSFEAAEDYIYDVAWSPTNPTLFSSVDGEGYIDLWDLSKDLEVPYIRHKGDSRALNKLSWSRDGSKMLTGSTDGHLKLYGLNKNLQKASEESLDKFETQIYNISKKEKKE